MVQGFTLVVAVVIATVGATVITSFASEMNGLVSAGHGETGFIEALAVQTGGLLASLAVLVFVGFMLFKSDDIAAAMIGGSSGGGVGGAILSRFIPSPKTGGGIGGKGGKS